MREIKFRAWDENNEVIIKDIQKMTINLSKMYMEGLILMQFTGLKDRKGKEIFEGDIIKDYDIVSKVVFENGMFLLASNDYGDGYSILGTYDFEEGSHHSLEVIGNIWENHELLEDKEL